MKVTSRCKTIALMAIAIFTVTVVSETSFADSVSYTDSFSLTGSGPETLTYQDFDSSLGTLTGVTIALNGNAAAVVEAFNISGGQVSLVNGATTNELSLSGTGFSTQTSQTLFASSMSGPLNSAQYSITNFAGAPSAVSLIGNVDSASFSQYTGSGTNSATSLSFGVGTTSASFTGGTGSASTGGQGSGAVEITYTYTPVPIPAAFPLLMSGLVGLAGVRGRRRRSLDITAA